MNCKLVKKMGNKSSVAEIEGGGKTFTGTYNAADDFLITQNHYLMAGLKQQQQQNSNFENSFIYPQNYLLN